MTWFEAEAYCAWLSYQKKQVVRLPIEEEWEYAARGEDGRPFPWGEEFEAQLANTLESELHDTIEAASMPGDVSPFGVMDMAGNVQQWTASQYTPMPDELFPPGPLRVVRGGSFNDTAYGSRTSYRRVLPARLFLSLPRIQSGGWKSLIKPYKTIIYLQPYASLFFLIKYTYITH